MNDSPETQQCRNSERRNGGWDTQNDDLSSPRGRYDIFVRSLVIYFLALFFFYLTLFHNRDPQLQGYTI